MLLLINTLVQLMQLGSLIASVLQMGSLCIMHIISNLYISVENQDLRSIYLNQMKTSNEYSRLHK